MDFNILTAIKNEDFIEYLRSFDIHLHTVQMHHELMAFIYYSKKGRHHVFINNKNCVEIQRKLILHELKHIVDDMPKLSYVIGLDMQYEPFETNAESFAKEIAATYAVK